ncbi:MAG: pyruvate, water dikinase regulatory protein [Methyloceanibacter sp.]|uniref:pyruvate, water dikinase regulatory protein n=1 Tax=Methyloceanibacter sp. TaxID=1965321 RepID=UPI003D6CD703
MDIQQRTFHLHMISDATGETLSTIAKAVGVQYAQVRAIEHLHPLVRSRRELDRVVKDVEAAPGIVLYTLFNRELADALEQSCKRLNLPCVAALKPILQVFESYLGTPATPTVGGQHVLDAEYFRRIEALNFTMVHDDGHLPENLNDADIILVGISRTSKTPTSIYLANRGFKTANVPLVPGMKLPPQVEQQTNAFVVALVASPERIAQVRQNRVIEQAHGHLEEYVDRDAIAAEIAQTRQLCARHGWPIIDVTRRSIEETAAAILRLYHDREAPALEA